MNIAEKMVWKIQEFLDPESLFKEKRRQKELSQMFFKEMDEEVGQYRHNVEPEELEKWSQKITLKYKRMGLDFDKL